MVVSSLFGFSGKIIDKKTSKAIKEAKICDSKICVKSDENGTFNIQTKDEVLHVKAIGYRPYKIDNNSTVQQLTPIRVKALYLTFWGASPYSKTFKKALDLIDKTELNSIIVDVKNEYGYTSYKTDVKKANEYKTYQKRTIKDIDYFIKKLNEKDIYKIARIVVFKDELQASNNPDYAIKKEKTAKIWRNHDNMAWVDPFDKKSWKYVLDIAEDAAKKGFDEINFDYIRFPAKDGLKLKRKSTQESRTKTIAAFIDYAQDRLRKYGVFISVDTYGNICWSNGDSNIGQTIEIFEKHADYVCPMLYPSGFAYGSFSFKYPASKPYEVYARSIKHIKDKINPKKVRPWIQAFRDYKKQRLRYGKKEIQAQIKACDDTNTNGWMLWSPSSKYNPQHYKASE